MLRQNRPEKGKGSRTIHFAYVPTQPGQQWHAYIAGPAMWFDIHAKGKSKPCLHAITDGELSCPQCEAGVRSDVIGYVPLWRELDLRPVMVIVHEPQREEIDKHTLHRRVIVGRGQCRGDAVYIIQAMKSEPRFSSSDPNKLKPVSLAESLLRMWRLEALTEWFAQTNGVRVESRSVDVAAAIEQAENTDEPVNRLPLNLDGIGDLLDQEAERARMRAMLAERNAKYAREQAAEQAATTTNGKHKKNKKT